MTRQILVTLILTQASLLGVIAYAGGDRGGRAREMNREPASLQRAQMRSEETRQIVEGLLRCPMPETNTGEGCALSIENAKTGETLPLAPSDAAMRLLSRSGHSPATGIAVVAELSGTRVLEIHAK